MAVAPLLGEAATALAAAGDADALFKAGRFEEAGRAYEEILKTDPTNVHAARQRGYVGLLANKFTDAETYLKRAVELAPGDRTAHEFLADCYLRQDKLALSVPHWRAIGEEAYAKWFTAVRGEPYQIHGDIGRAEFVKMDPMPQVEASVNGGPPKKLTFYTGAPSLSLTSTVAKEAGLSAVASEKIDFEGGHVWAHYGVLESFRLGGLELRNVPVGWSTTEAGEDVDTDNDGLIGTWVFYHLLTTFDYANRALILRRPTPEAVRTASAGVKPLPLWLAADHYLHSLGSIAGSGTQVVGTNFGGGGEMAAVVFGDTAERLRIRTDHGRPLETSAHSTPTVVYPCYPKEIRVGSAVAKDIYCENHPTASIDGLGFDAPAAFFHCFWKPCAVTLDFTGMNLYVRT
ncbi:tetratricopeptide repeat protein [Lentzea flava]|uniref:tetratricopeptide repeat protein n=1 Tax=Lentzea flava TaxID=103732 RepID=UPI00167110AF|nr:tetratricopeptide repeat protein [Lentzea flava]